MFLNKRNKTRESKNRLACLHCRELFKSLDTDASNTIEAKELADGLKAQGYNISQQELSQLMGRVDFDRNGTLDLEEFISGLIDWSEVQRCLRCLCQHTDSVQVLNVLCMSSSFWGFLSVYKGSAMSVIPLWVFF